ncbi:MAG: hypothetical protein NTW21_29725 [Verrucomicrobia bacterium]|nr:hypothetical protein [Verrucomicrobiota bacterium]
MSPISTSPQFYGTPAAVGHSPIRLMSLLRLIFFSGPKVLVSSQISVKCAVAMVTMCAPALLFCALLTLPALIFQSPQQHAYFYFAKVLDEDPTRWFVLFLSGICVILSLALPATMSAPRDSMDL